MVCVEYDGGEGEGGNGNGGDGGGEGVGGGSGGSGGGSEGNGGGTSLKREPQMHSNGTRSLAFEPSPPNANSNLSARHSG